MELVVLVKKVYDWSKGRYGSPRIAKELQKQGKQVSIGFVAKIMKVKNIKCVRVRRFKQTANSKHIYSVVDKKLNQDFRVQESNQAWVSNITYIKTMERWIYLASVIDLFNRKVIEWHMSNNMRTSDTVIPALKKASSATSPQYRTDFSLR